MRTDERRSRQRGRRATGQGAAGDRLRRRTSPTVAARPQRRSNRFAAATPTTWPDIGSNEAYAGRLAQLGEHLPYKQGVGGSSPSPPIKESSANAPLAFAGQATARGAGSTAGSIPPPAGGSGETAAGIDSRAPPSKLPARAVKRPAGSRGCAGLAGSPSRSATRSARRSAPCCVSVDASLASASARVLATSPARGRWIIDSRANVRCSTSARAA
jgi:hypothetical protein